MIAIVVVVVMGITWVGLVVWMLMEPRGWKQSQPGDAEAKKKAAAAIINLIGRR
jgi:hypothetical protein